MTPQDEARERAAEALDRVERTLAAPRPEGPLHTLTTGETFEEWHARVGTESPAPPPPRQAPRTAIGAMTDDQFALLAQDVAESDGAMKIVAHTVHDGSEQQDTPEATP